MLPLMLSALACEADRARFLALYEENHAAMERAAMSILRDQQDAEDWAQIENQPGPEGAVSYRALVDLFARLPQTYRAALEMRFLLGYSNKEIAQRLSLTQTAVNTRIARGRELLKKLAEEEGIHP